MDAIPGPRESSADAVQHVGDRRGLLPGLVTAVLELRLPEEVADEALQVPRLPNDRVEMTVTIVE